MAEFGQPRREGLPDHAGAEDADVHGASPLMGEAFASVEYGIKCFLLASSCADFANAQTVFAFVRGIRR
jgi:hypothetical protein